MCSLSGSMAFKLVKPSLIDGLSSRRNRPICCCVLEGEMEAPMTLNQPDPINNPGSDPDTLTRRSGGSADDPHGAKT